MKNKELFFRVNNDSYNFAFELEGNEWYIYMNDKNNKEELKNNVNEESIKFIYIRKL